MKLHYFGTKKMGLRSQVLLVSLLALFSRTATAAFTTVIDLSSGSPALTVIESNTQLNLRGGVIREDFNAGSPLGTSVNVEMNISSGRVRDRMNANSGSVINISGGEI